MKRFVNLTWCVLLASPALAANEPARPAPRAGESRAEASPARRRVIDYTNPNWSPNAEEEAEAKSFLEKNCPRRYATVQRGRKDAKVPVPLVRSYFDLEALRTAEPDLYDMKVQQVQLEDKIFGLTENLHGKPTTQSAELREKVRQLVQLRITEHQKRLDKLRFVADSEELKLNQLKNNLDRAVDEELERQRNKSESLAKQNAPGPRRDKTSDAIPVPKEEESRP